MFNFNNYFDCIYCINLPHRTDRLNQFKKRNATKLGTNKVEFFTAINGNNITDNSWQYSKGALGCRSSHLAVYKDALAKNYSKILILEDDVVLKKGFERGLKLILKAVSNNWDMIYFGGTHFIKPDQVNKNFVKLNGTLALHAVAINCKCLELLITNIETDKRWIDAVIAGLHKQLNVYGFTKPLAIQSEGYSDIEESYINYNLSLYSKIVFKIKKVFKF